MSTPDLNLLVTLDVLLEEGSVARAAERLRLSPSAMSRALARLRAATGDPLLVRAGRGLVPTPRAAELRAEVGRLVEEARHVLAPARTLHLAGLRRTFTIRASDGFVETFGPALVEATLAEAPGVRLRFVPKPYRESGPLREGAVDCEIGVVGERTAPEVRAQGLFRDRFVAVVRPGHPLLDGEVTPERYADARHVLVSRRGLAGDFIDATLEPLGLARDIAITVPGFAAALSLARGSDLVASVPERQTGALRLDLRSFALPVPTPDLTVSLLWHPRLDADPAHRWLRERVRASVRAS